RRWPLPLRRPNRARRSVWLVAGREKAEMLARLCETDRSIPAGRVRQERGVVLADQEATTLTARRGDRIMHVGIATDHGGFELKEDLIARLRAAGHDVVDVGADTPHPDDDYPDFAIPLAQAV